MKKEYVDKIYDLALKSYEIDEINYYHNYIYYTEKSYSGKYDLVLYNT